MTTSEIHQSIAERLGRIETLALTDPETAHVEEDALHRFVLEEVSLGTLAGADAQVAATVALTSRTIEFSRWYS